MEKFIFKWDTLVYILAYESARERRSLDDLSFKINGFSSSMCKGDDIYVPRQKLQGGEYQVVGFEDSFGG